MQADPRRIGRMLGALAITAICGFIGLMAGIVFSFGSTRVVEYPAAHRVAPRPDATPLSVAMVYDVVHGLYPEHGPAWHRAVERRAREAIAATPAEGPVPAAVLDAHDDLAVALDRLHRTEEALAVMDRKAAGVARTWPEPPPATALDAHAPLPALSPDRHAWYRTRANRGTVRIHHGLPRLMRDPTDAEARAEAEAGLADIRASIALNPGAHFGREQWQAYAVAGLLAALDDPTWFTERDLIGQRFDGGPIDRRGHGAYGLPTDTELAAGLDADQRRAARERVPAYPPEAAWIEAVGHGGEPVPFDEPALAMIGMWLYGGGPNPHFALSLGLLMERIEQPYVAWAAYARALEMPERFGPARQWLEPRCRERLAALTAELGQTEDELRAAYDDERARGEAFRAAQAAFEAGLDDPLAAGALDPFFAGREPIRTPPDRADRAFVKVSGLDDRWTLLAFALWGAALGAWLAGGRLRARAG